MLLNFTITIINFNFSYVKIDPIHNSIVLICNTVIVGFDILLSLQIKTEFHKSKSILFNSLANDIEEDLMLTDITNLEYNRIINRFKELLYRNNFSIPQIIFKKLKKETKFEYLEFEEMIMLNPIDLINTKNDN